MPSTYNTLDIAQDEHPGHPILAPYEPLIQCAQRPVPRMAHADRSDISKKLRPPLPAAGHHAVAACRAAARTCRSPGRVAGQPVPPRAGPPAAAAGPRAHQALVRDGAADLAQQLARAREQAAAQARQPRGRLRAHADVASANCPNWNGGPLDADHGEKSHRHSLHIWRLAKPVSNLLLAACTMGTISCETLPGVKRLRWNKSSPD